MNMPSSRHHLHTRNGKVLVLLAILLPASIGIAGLVIDGGLMLTRSRQLQNAADAASLAAATDRMLGKPIPGCKAAAVEVVTVDNGIDANVEVNIPPLSGAHSGDSNYVEVIARLQYTPLLMHVVSIVSDDPLEVRSVSGAASSNVGTALVVLDPEPAELSYGDVASMLAGIDLPSVAASAAGQSAAVDGLSAQAVVGPIAASLLTSGLEDIFEDVLADTFSLATSSLPSTHLPSLTAGMEVEGAGTLWVDGAVHVNNRWGDRDERGLMVGIGVAPPHALACMPLAATTRLGAREIRVTGGVDSELFYEPFDSDEAPPLRAGTLPVPNPFAAVPTPSVLTDSDNVDASNTQGHVIKVVLSPAQADDILANVLTNLPLGLGALFTPLIDGLKLELTEATVEPGVYESLTVIAPLGGVRFEPGIYIIRNQNPDTGSGLAIVGPVQAEGVMFYLTQSANFNAETGTPDSTEDSSVAPPNTITGNLPGALILPLLPTARITGLDDPNSPFDGMLIYQRPLDRGIVLIEGQQLLGTNSLAGSVYNKWGHTLLIGGGGGESGLRVASGTLRVITAGNMRILPTPLLEPATDALLVE